VLVVLVVQLQAAQEPPGQVVQVEYSLETHTQQLSQATCQLLLVMAVLVVQTA